MSPQLDILPPKSEPEASVQEDPFPETDQKHPLKHETTIHNQPAAPSVRDLVVLGGLFVAYVVGLSFTGVAQFARSICPKLDT